MRNVATLVILCGVALLSGCPEPNPLKQEAASISQKVRVQNLKPRIEQAYALSDTESVRILIVPGWPMGEKCLVYSNATSSTMQCREILPQEQ